MSVATRSVVGRGVLTGCLPPEEVREIARQGLAQLPLDGKRVLVGSQRPLELLNALRASGVRA